MRVWIALLIALSFALQGWAATRAADAPCPMEAEMAVAMAQIAAVSEGAADDAMSGDCCNDMATFSLTGQACKTGQDCQAKLTALPLPLPDKTTVAAVRQTAPVLQSLAAPSATVVALWRPPTFH
jgi:hypothetical protein